MLRLETTLMNKPETWGILSSMRWRSPFSSRQMPLCCCFSPDGSGCNTSISAKRLGTALLSEDLRREALCSPLPTWKLRITNGRLRLRIAHLLWLPFLQCYLTMSTFLHQQQGNNLKPPCFHLAIVKMCLFSNFFLSPQWLLSGDNHNVMQGFQSLKLPWRY